MRRSLAETLRDQLSILFPDAILDDATDDEHCPWFVVGTPVGVDLIAEFNPTGFELKTYEGRRVLAFSAADYSHARVVSWLAQAVAALGSGFTLH